jgi:hypothetical protein
MFPIEAYVRAILNNHTLSLHNNSLDYTGWGLSGVVRDTTRRTWRLRTNTVYYAECISIVDPADTDSVHS